MVKQVYEEKTEFIRDYIETLTGPLPAEIKRDFHKLKLSTIYNLGVLIQRVKENQDADARGVERAQKESSLALRSQPGYQGIHQEEGKRDRGEMP